MNLLGQRFGKLMVMEKAPNDLKRRDAMWKCQCDCGKETTTRAYSLTSKHTLSCGCLQRESASKQEFKDLSGKRVGRLLVNKKVGNNKHGASKWECLCDCGNTTIVISRQLITNRTRSCGCLYIEYIKSLPLKTGDRAMNWRGGITKESFLIRTSPLYKEWRTCVFERDNYTCVWCGVYGGKLNADHIKPFSAYPELRFDLNNGRTLCIDCHKKTPTYGINALNYIDQSEEDIIMKRKSERFKQHLIAQLLRQQKEFSFVSPDGVLYKGYNVTEFGKYMNITTHNQLSGVRTKRKRHFKKWTLPKESFEYSEIVLWEKRGNIVYQELISI